MTTMHSDVSFSTLRTLTSAALDLADANAFAAAAAIASLCADIADKGADRARPEDVDTPVWDRLLDLFNQARASVYPNGLDWPGAPTRSLIPSTFLDPMHAARVLLD